jgi:hypothetical protein
MNFYKLSNYDLDKLHRKNTLQKIPKSIINKNKQEIISNKLSKEHIFINKKKDRQVSNLIVVPITPEKLEFHKIKIPI